MRRVLEAGFLLCVLVFAQGAGAQTPAPAGELERVLDADLSAMKNQSAAGVRALEKEAATLKSKVSGLTAERDRLETANKELERNKSIFNRNGKRLQENHGRLQKIAGELQSLNGQLQSKSADLRRKRANLNALLAETERRGNQYSTVKAVDLERLEIFDAEKLQGARGAYEAIVLRQRLQGQSIEERLQRYGNQMNQEALRLQDTLNALKVENQKARVALSKVTDELARRQNDQAIEQQELDALREKKQQIMELQSRRAQLAKQKDRPLEIDKFFKSPDEEQERKAMVERRERERLQLRLYVGFSIVIFVGILMVVKRAFSR